MKRLLCSLIVAVFFVVVGGAHIAQGAQGAATLDDAKALVEKAVAYWKAHGRDKALAELNNPKGQFVKGELYVVAQDFSGNVLANAVNPERVGLNFYELRDPNGKYFSKDLIEVAKTKGSGIVEFVFANPVTKKFQPKTNYVKKVEGEDVAIICGIFHWHFFFFAQAPLPAPGARPG